MNTRKDVFKKVMAALFLVAGIFLIFAVIWRIGTERGVTQPKVEVSVLFRNVDGLSTGAPVRLSGVTVGVVGDIEFLDESVQERDLRVELFIYKKFETQLKRAKSFEIRTEGILGEKYVDIRIAALENAVNWEEPVLGEDPMDVQDLARVLQETATAITQATNGLNDLTRELQYISRKSKRVLDRIEERLIDGNLFKVF